MTDAEKDAAWRSLPEFFKEKVRRDYAKAVEALKFDPKNVWIEMHILFLAEYFGKHNLTATEDEKPKMVNKEKMRQKLELQEYAAKNRKRLEVQEVKLGDVVKILRGVFAGEHGTVKEVQAFGGYDPDDLFFSVALGHEVPEKYRMHPNSLAKNVIGGLSNTDFEVIGSKVNEPKSDVQQAEMEKAMQESLNIMESAERAEYWQRYRMELAKEIAQATIQATQSFNLDLVMSTVDGIVERLKGGVNNG